MVRRAMARGVPVFSDAYSLNSAYPRNFPASDPNGRLWFWGE